MNSPTAVEAMWSPWEKAGSEHLRLIVDEEIRSNNWFGLLLLSSDGVIGLVPG